MIKWLLFPLFCSIFCCQAFLHTPQSHLRNNARIGVSNHHSLPSGKGLFHSTRQDGELSRLNSNKRNALMVLTNHAFIERSTDKHTIHTGWYLPECAHPFLRFKKVRSAR